MEYKRLTRSDDSHRPYADACFKCIGKECNKCDLDYEIWERLAELEDKIEQGTLIELPCKDFGAFPCEMGATVWLIYKRYLNVADKNGFWVLRESKVSQHNKKRFSDDFG